ncbi:MAG: hypothetical protein AABY83_06495 [Pseudomonadota bacterium]
MEGFGSWSVLTTNFILCLYIALGGVTLSAILHLVNGKWRFVVRNLACSLAVMFPVAFVLMIVLLANGENTFQWLAQAREASAHGGGGHHLPGWHNYAFLATRQIVGFFVVAGLYGLFIKLQHQATIDDSYPAQRRFRNIALVIPGIYVLYGTMIAWDYEMTMIPNWHSASYSVYHFVSNFHFFLAFFAFFLFMLNKSGKLTKEMPSFVFNHLAQMMLAFTILWTYFFFTQYLIMWYGRLPEEIFRFRNMMENGLAPIWWTFVTLKFIIPFCSYIFAVNRHTPSIIATISVGIMVGTWLERYTWISGSVDPKFYHLPMTSMFDIAVTVLVIGVAIAAMRWSLTRFGLMRA